MRFSGKNIRGRSFSVSIFSAVLIAASVYLLDFNRSDPGYAAWPTWILDLFEGAQAYSLHITILSTSVWLITQWYSNSTRDWVAIHTLLGYIRDKVFQDVNGDPKHYHRVTLFQFKRRLWRLGYIRDSLKSVFMSDSTGWLVPVCRSGHLTQKSAAAFRLEDSGSYEGVCGFSWSSGEIKVFTKLPKVTKDSSAQIVQKYADATHCRVDQLRTTIIRAGLSKCRDNEVIFPRSIGAIPAGTPTTSGATKYVLVLDSRNAEGVPEDIGKQYRVVLQLLGYLLDGGVK